MTGANSELVTVTPAQTVSAIHYLAASSHRLESQWAELAQPLLDEYPDASMYDVRNSMERADLAKLMRNSAERAADMTRHAVHGLPYDGLDTQPIIARNQDRLTAWLGSVAETTIERRSERLYRARTPFMRLSQAEQAPDYTEATAVLQAVAEIGGLVLPEQLPEVEPLSGKWRNRTVLKHTFGIHGAYVISEQPWLFTCQMCEVEIPAHRL